MDIHSYSYHVMWSAEDQEYVGLCVEFPLLSWLEPTQEEAFSGIRTLVADVVANMESSSEVVPEPMGDGG